MHICSQGAFDFTLDSDHFVGRLRVCVFLFVFVCADVEEGILNENSPMWVYEQQQAG